MTVYPLYPTRDWTCLDGLWDFAFLGNADLENLDLGAIKFDRRVAVPGCFDTLPSLAGVRGTAVYRTHITCRPGAGLLRFSGLGLWARIYVDGIQLHTATLPYSGFDVYLPATVRHERELTVVVDNRFDFDRVPLQEQFFDFYAYGGLYRSVYFGNVPDLWIDRARVTTTDLKSGTVQLELVLGGGDWDGKGASLAFDGGNEQSVDLKAGAEKHFTGVFQVPHPRPWSPANPQLHTLTLGLPSGDVVVERFGLRTVEARGGQILVNGQAVKLLGYCRHEASLDFGPALPLATLLSDLERLKDLGCNFVRGSHYPQDPRWLDLCDEAGLLVFEEALGWGQRERQFVVSEFARQQEAQVRLMVRNSFNHPSVILWGFLNEGLTNSPTGRPLYQRLTAAVREEDSSRLVTFATMFPFDDLCLDLADVVSVNQYPGWYAADKEVVRPLGEIRPFLQRLKASLKERGFSAKPLLMSEIGAGALYGWRDPLNAHWTEDYQADYLAEVCQAIVDDPAYSGVSLWQFHDVRTYASTHALVRPRGINDKGTLDEYRRPKAAYREVRRIFRAARGLGPGF